MARVLHVAPNCFRRPLYLVSLALVVNQFILAVLHHLLVAEGKRCKNQRNDYTNRSAQT